MRLNILSLQTGSRELADVSIHDTVDGLKAKLSEERLVDAQPTGLRLIHSGKTLAVGSERLSDAGVAEGDVIVVVKRRVGRETHGNNAKRTNPRLMLRLLPRPCQRRVLGQREKGGMRIWNEVGCATRTRHRATCRGWELMPLPSGTPQGGAGMRAARTGRGSARSASRDGFRSAREEGTTPSSHQSAAMEWLLEVGDGPEADAELTEGQVHHVMTSLGMRQPVLRRQRAARRAGREPRSLVVRNGFPSRRYWRLSRRRTTTTTPLALGS